MGIPIVTSRSSGQQQNSSSSIGSSTAGTLTVDAQKVACILIATARSDTVTNVCRVTAVSATGLTFTEVFDEGIEFNVGGSFPITNWHVQLFTAPVSTAVSALSWSSTMSAGFVNEQIAIIFDVADLADKANPFDGGVGPGSATHYTSSSLSSTPSTASVNLTTASNDDRFLSIFLDSNPDADSGPVTASVGSGQTLVAVVQSNRQYAEGNLLVQTKSSSIPVTTEAQATGFSSKFQLNVTLAFTGDSSFAATVAARPTALVAEVLENIAGNIVVTAAAAEVLANEPANLVVTATAVEVLRSVADEMINGDAFGTTITVTTLLVHDADASGSTITATTSINEGAADAYVPIPGQTLTATSSISNVGMVVTIPIDGSPIYEVVLTPESSTVYQTADYDSIWGRGERVVNGLIDVGSYGFDTVAFLDSAFNDRYSIGPGDGPTISGTFNPGDAWWFEFNGGQKIDLRAFKFVGNETIDTAWFFKFVGGLSAGVIETEAYGKEFDTANRQQGPDDDPVDAAVVSSEYPMTPRIFVPYSHYEFVYDSGTQTDSRFCNEIWLKVAHSNLDGGDRRPTNGQPAKQVLFTMSSHWSASADPQDVLFDGIARSPTATKTTVAIGTAANPNNPVSTVGAWLQFVFPRPVIMNHLLFLANNNQEIYDSGDLPTHFGTWHWEYSLNSGASWTSIGDPWSFSEGVQYMIAPRDGSQFALGPIGTDGKGATHWRMVLDQGPALGSGNTLWQVIFDLIDVTGQAPPLSIAFSDDADGVPATPTIGGPGSPYVIAFTDGTDDKLTATVVNTPNAVLVIAFDDGGSFDTWSDIFPSVVVQTIVIATGSR